MAMPLDAMVKAKRARTSPISGTLIMTTAPAPRQGPRVAATDVTPEEARAIACDYNRPHRPATPSAAVWRLHDRVALNICLPSYSTAFFDSTWAYEVKVVHRLRCNGGSMALSALHRAMPLPEQFAQTEAAFVQFFASRGHIFEVRGGGVRGRSGAQPFLEWKRRVLAYLAGRKACAYRATLTQVFQAAPLSFEALDGELEEARRGPWQYLKDRLGDAVWCVGKIHYQDAKTSDPQP